MQTRVWNKANHVLVWFSARHFTDKWLVERVGTTLNITIIAFTISAQLQTTKLGYCIGNVAYKYKYSDILHRLNQT